MGTRFAKPAVAAFAVHISNEPFEEYHDRALASYDWQITDSEADLLELRSGAEDKGFVSQCYRESAGVSISAGGLQSALEHWKESSYYQTCVADKKTAEILDEEEGLDRAVSDREHFLADPQASYTQKEKYLDVFKISFGGAALFCLVVPLLNRRKIDPSEGLEHEL